VESVRESKRVRQKVLRHIITAKEGDDFEKIREIAEYACVEMQQRNQSSLFQTAELAAMVLESRRKLQSDTSPLPVNLKNLREEHRIITGIHDVYGTLFDRACFGQALKGCKVSRQVFKDIVMARLANPVSKRSSCEMLEKRFGKTIALEKVYRMLDRLGEEKIKKIQDIAWNFSKTLLTGEVRIFFYDCTTLYFESFTEDELRRFGYSKDHKFNQGQVLLALLVTEEGLPVGYDVFAGNMYEGNTFSLAIKKLKERYGIKKAVVVADSGLMSDNNVVLLEESGLEYILGARLKTLNVKWQNRILDNHDYKIFIKEDEETASSKNREKEVLRIYDFDYTEKRRLIVSHSNLRAKKDQRDREKAVERLQEKLAKSKNPASLISNYGYKKFLSIEGDVTVKINEEKMQAAALWDGLHGVFTNTKRKELDAHRVLEQYHGLWQVEDSFRINKHDLRVRPVFHWNADRIRAHIAVCFVAFALIRFMQHLIKKELNENFSAQRISEELISVQESILLDCRENNRYVIPSKTSEDAKRLYGIMRLQRSQMPYRLMAK
jgi:transposase